MCSSDLEDPDLMKQTLTNVYENLSQDGVGICNATVSPIKGHKGNTEFLALLEKKSEGGDYLSCEEFLKAVL